MAIQHALRQLEHFFSGLLSSSEFWAAIGGGVLAGLFSLLAQKHSARDEHKRWERAEESQLIGMLLAIATELEVFKSGLLDSLYVTLQQRADARAAISNTGFSIDPLPVVRTELSSFVIYDSNAVLLGKVRSNALRRSIISIYGRSKGLLDSLNTLAVLYDDWRRQANSNEKLAIEHKCAALERQLVSGLPTLRKGIDDLVNELKSLVGKTSMP